MHLYLFSLLMSWRPLTRSSKSASLCARVNDASNGKSTIGSLISAVERGEQSAAGPLFAALYDELHRLARHELARHGAPRSVSVTTLLHEAYLNIASRQGAGAEFPDRARFMGYAARVMRGLIIDHARSRQARKRGGEFEFISLDTDLIDAIADDNIRRLADLGAAIDALAAVDPMLAEVVDLKFFCGFSFAEIAAMRGAAERTIQRHWEKARLYLHRALRDQAI